MLEDLIDTPITEMIEGDQNHNVIDFIFQHYGAPPHYDATIREF